MYGAFQPCLLGTDAARPAITHGGRRAVDADDSRESVARTGAERGASERFVGVEHRCKRLKQPIDRRGKS